VQSAGRMYGVEDLAVFLYSIVRMHKPKLMIELGSGSGACSLFSARGMSENGEGKVLSFDNGSQWERIRKRSELGAFLPNPDSSHHEFLVGLSERFLLTQHVTYIEQTFPPFPNSELPIDILFVDYESGHPAIAAILAHFLPKMAAASSVFIDGASTSFTSFLFLEKLIRDLNHGKFSSTISRLVPNDTLDTWTRLVQTRQFTLIHLTRQRDAQNSTAWIKIEPVDHLPYPVTKMR
jgi:Methyltransferase domain